MTAYVCAGVWVGVRIEADHNMCRGQTTLSACAALVGRKTKVGAESRENNVAEYFTKQSERSHIL